MSATTSASGSAAMSEPSGSTTADTVGSRATATKRKLADAFQSLDAATEAAGPPTKKAHTGRSLYATLAKYGVKTKQAANPQFASLSKGTPHLTAILARAATRTRKALPFASSSAAPLPPLPATAEYRPSSIPSFLARLATFKLATYANKPPQLDAVAAAKCGWTNDGKDRLVCGFCAVSWVVAGREGMGKDAANALVERQRLALVSAHKNGCPWRENQCDASIYRIPLQAPAVMIREIKTTAAVLDPVMQQMEVKHPLTASQLASLAATVSAFTLPAPEEGATPPPDPSETAILTALFGWAPAPPTAPDRPRVSSLSRPSSRATSRAGSPFSASTPPRLARSSTLATSTTAVSSLSASTSVSDLATTSTPAPAPPSTPPRQFLRRVSSAASPLARRDNTTTSLLHCALCQRRVGLWAFAPPPAEPSTPPPKSRLGPRADGQAVPISERARAPAPQRHFDLLKEHRSFCPYVVRSTVVPSLPAADAEVGRASTSSAARPLTSSSVGGNGTLEGWRAVLTVVLRYGLGQRQRERAAAVRRRVSTQSMEGGDGDSAMDVDAVNGNGEGEDAAVDNVEAMVESVKANGGKDYLRYVRRLLG